MNLQRWLASGRTRLVIGALLLAVALVVAIVTSGTDRSDSGQSGSGQSGPRQSGQGAIGSAPSTAPGTTTHTPGSLQPVAVDDVTPEPPIALTETADFGSDVTLRISKVEEVRGTARGPGEIAGPALRLTLELKNTSKDPLSLEPLVVALEASRDHTPAPSLTGPDSKPFAGTLAPGRSATGVYVFTVPKADRDVVEVTVSATNDEPVVVFTGAVQP